MAQATMRLATEGGRKLPRKVHLGKRFIESIPTPADGQRVTIYDDIVPGLCIRVTPTARSFYLYRKVNGHPMRLKLGTFPALVVENARKAAQRHLGAIAGGKDPREEKRAINASMTLSQLWKRWQDEYAKPRHRPRTLLTDENRYATCLERWKNRKVASIREADVRNLHGDLAKEKGQTTANRAVQLLRRLFNFARIQPNPAGNRAVSFFPEKTRDRFLLPNELPRFFAAMEKEPNQTLKDFFYACLYTGQRRSNVQSMRWEEIDLEAKTWTIPGSKTKNGEPHRVHLAAPMLDLLKRREADGEKKVKDGDERYARGYVFPCYRVDSKCPHLNEPKAAWKRLLTRANLKDLRIHDLRRSLGSWAAMTGASLPIIGKVLGHLDQTSTAIYARLDLDPARLAQEAAVQAMQQVVQKAAQEQKAKTRKEKKAKPQKR
jgi:integrase